MKTIIIPIPLGVQTGGPEALHQLSDALIGQGHDARVWYVTPTDLPALDDLFRRGGLQPNTVVRLQARTNTVEGYQKYRTVPATEIVLNHDTGIVLAETYVHWLKYFQACKPVLWWLSVDNAFEYLAVSKVNLNQLRTQRVVHAYQSSYARAFAQALGCHRLLPLSDYTPAGEQEVALPKTDIALNANHKVIYDVQAIAEQLQRECQVNVHLIRGMSRSQVYETLQRSKLFIDLGCFPGKDRLAREALTRNCCVFALDVGAARDYGLPEEFYFGADQVGEIHAAARTLISRYDFYLNLLQPAQQAVARERLIFEREAAGLVHELKR